MTFMDSFLSFVIFICFVFLAAVLLFAIVLVGFNSPTEGFKTGQLVKVSRQGFFHTTCEAEIIKGGIVNSSTGGFHFTIKSEEECKRAESFLSTDDTVLVTYEKPLFYSRFNTESGVYGVVN